MTLVDRPTAGPRTRRYAREWEAVLSTVENGKAVRISARKKNLRFALARLCGRAGLWFRYTRRGAFLLCWAERRAMPPLSLDLRAELERIGVPVE